jgi:chemotaxis protein MotB
LLALYGNQVSKQQEVLEGMRAKSALQLWKTTRPSIVESEQTGDPAPTMIEKITEPAPATDKPEPTQQTTEPAPGSAEQSALDDISQKVAAQGLGDMVTLESRKGGLIITMKETLLFPSGQASLSAQGAAWIRGIVPVMQSDAAFISVEGHTDNVPISTEKFPSNWELSAGRASSVVRELVAAGVNADKLRAIGYADSRPIGFNAFPSGREQNRRVQIKLNYSGTEEETIPAD